MSGSRCVRSYRGAIPRVHPTAWLAPGSTVVGDVEIGADSSVWYGTVLRGDVHSIRIGSRTNLQDHCVVHVTAGRFPCIVGDEVTVGHRAVVHGCTVEDGALIGIGAVVLDGARVEAEAWVAAGALVTPGSVVPRGMLARGGPAKVFRTLDDSERAEQRELTLRYVETARHHAAEDPE